VCWEGGKSFYHVQGRKKLTVDSKFDERERSGGLLAKRSEWAQGD